MTSQQLLNQIERLLQDAGEPLLAKEISAQLQRGGLEVDKRAVNVCLYAPDQQRIVKDESHRWGLLQAKIVQIVDTAASPLRAREISAELSRAGFRVDKTTINQILYQRTQVLLVKGDDHRWRRTGSEAKSEGRPARARKRSQKSRSNMASHAIANASLGPMPVNAWAIGFLAVVALAVLLALLL